MSSGYTKGYSYDIAKDILKEKQMELINKILYFSWTPRNFLYILQKLYMCSSEEDLILFPCHSTQRKGHA